MKENSIEKTLENIQNVDLITLLRKFKKEGVENFITIRRNDFDEILSDYKRVSKENEELKKFHIQDNKHLDFIIKNSITVQKVKDKIEKEIKYHGKNILDIENITMLKGKTAKEEAKIEFNKYVIVVLKKMLQELLESEE